MTQEQKIKIGKHFDELHATASGLVPNVPDDLKEVLKASYIAGAGYALDNYCPQWISVEEALPDRHKTVFSEPVIATDGRIVGIDFYNHQEGEWESFRNPTHWMFLPDVPEKGGEE